jgi:hypothetical protein
LKEPARTNFAHRSKGIETEGNEGNEEGKGEADSFLVKRGSPPSFPLLPSVQKERRQRHDRHANCSRHNRATLSPILLEDRIMQPQSLGGLFLIIVGVLALIIRSFTYFTTEQVVGPFGIFAWNVDQPHTIFINPIVGIVAIALGIGLMMMGRRRLAA